MELNDGRYSRWWGAHGRLRGGQNFASLGGESSDLLLKSCNLMGLQYSQLLQSLNLFLFLSSSASTHLPSLGDVKYQ